MKYLSQFICLFFLITAVNGSENNNEINDSVRLSRDIILVEIKRKQSDNVVFDLKIKDVEGNVFSNEKYARFEYKLVKNIYNAEWMGATTRSRSLYPNLFIENGSVLIDIGSHAYKDLNASLENSDKINGSPSGLLAF